MAAAFYPKYKTCLSIFPLTQFLSLIRPFNCLFLDFGLMLIVCYLSNCYKLLQCNFKSNIISNKTFLHIQHTNLK